MKRSRYFYSTFLVACLFTTSCQVDPPNKDEASAAPPRPKVLFRANFNGESDDGIAERMLAHQHNELAKGAGPDGSDALRTEYVGYDLGSKRVVMFFPLKEAVVQATLSFDVRFEENFQWRRTGKLHGLGPVRTIAGGQERHPDGWSARLNFRDDGRCATYLYDQSVGKTYGVGTLSQDPVFTRGKWHHVTMQVGLNTNGKKNGFTRASIDGKHIIETRDVEFRGEEGPETLIHQFIFSTFHGGNSPDFAPKDENGNYVTVHALFDNFEVTTGGPSIQSPTAAN